MNKKIVALIYSNIFILSLMFLVDCFGGLPATQMGEIQNTGILLSNLLPGKFAKLWVERTIQLKATFEGSQNQLGPSGGGFIPLIAQATFIDSTLIECGLSNFRTLSEMSENEKQEYVKIYKETYKIGSYHFVWLELQTPYTEEILDLNRWNFYLEDDKGNQYDPKEIIEYSIGANKNPFQNSTLAHRDSVNNKFENLEISSKTVLLYFPKVNINGEKIIDDNKTISLVIFNWSNKNAKNKGTWELKSINQKSNS